MEAALRTVYEIITGRELPWPDLHVPSIVGLEQIKEGTIKLENVKPEWKAAEGFEVPVLEAAQSALKLCETYAVMNLRQSRLTYHRPTKI